MWYPSQIRKVEQETEEMDAPAGTSSAADDKYQWTTHAKRTLIQFYSSNEFLHKPTHPDYKKKGLRAATMKIIADMLKCSVDEAKGKFHSLRTYFNKEWVKTHTKRSGQGTGDNYVSKWEFYEDLCFLKTSLTPEASSSSLEELAVESTSSSPSTTPEEDTADTATPPEVRRPASKKKRSAQAQPVREQVFQHAPKVLSGAREDNGDHAFGEAVATAIANLDEFRKDLVKMRIMQVIFEVKHSTVVEEA